MTERAITHSTFSLERTYPVPVERVYNAFADPVAKAKWFAGPDEWGGSTFEMDFREGGREYNSGGPAEGPVHHFESVYQDIVPNERIVYTYAMKMDDTRISVSLATREFEPEGDGTKFTITELGAFLDGHDTVDQRKEGTSDLLDALGAALQAANLAE